MDAMTALLLKARVCGRFDARYKGGIPKPTREEAAMEQASLAVKIPPAVHQEGQRRGWIAWDNGTRLTESGSAELIIRLAGLPGAR